MLAAATYPHCHHHSGTHAIVERPWLQAPADVGIVCTIFYQTASKHKAAELFANRSPPVIHLFNAVIESKLRKLLSIAIQLPRSHHYRPSPCLSVSHPSRHLSLVLLSDRWPHHHYPRWHYHSAYRIPHFDLPIAKSSP